MDASSLITSFEEFEPETITYGAPRLDSRGNKTIKINSGSGNSLVLSTPLLLTWGINKMTDDDSGRVSYSLSLQFPNDNYASDEARMFLDKLKTLENKIIDDAVKNRKEWFNNNKLTREVAEVVFNYFLKHPKDKQTNEIDETRAPTMRIKIPYWENKFNVELYDMEENTLFVPDMSDKIDDFTSIIPKASHVIAGIQCGGIYYINGKFGITWRLIQAMVQRPVRLQGGCFLKPSSNDMAALHDIKRKQESETGEADALGYDEPASAPAPAPAPEPVSTEVEDSEDEAPAPAPAPAKAPVKKTVKKTVVKKKVVKK